MISPGGRTLLGGALLLLALAAAVPARAEVLDRIAAVVNDEVITLREVRRAAAPAFAGLTGIASEELLRQEQDRVLRDALDELIGQLLLWQSAQELKITVDAAEISEYVDQVKRQYSWDDAAMNEALQREGSSLEEFRLDVRKRLTTSRLVQMKLGSTVRVSEAEVDEALRREYSTLASQTELTLRHIMLLVAEGASPDEEARVRDKAREVLDRARQPGADFAELARTLSEGPGAERGGDLGSVTRGMLDPAFEQAAFSATVGEVVGPVRTRYGYHLIQVTRSRELEPKEEPVLRREVQARLRQAAMERAMKRWIVELRRKAFIDVKLWPGPAAGSAATQAGTGG